MAEAAGFFGTYEHALDSKGRVVLPAKFRPYFRETRIRLTPHFAGSVAIWTEEEFAKEFAAHDALSGQGHKAFLQMLAWSSKVEDQTVDAQGRILVPQKLREHAKLELDQQVLFVGAMRHVELWSPQRFYDLIASLGDDQEGDEADRGAPAGVVG